MSNSEYQTTTVVESKNPSADAATIGANTSLGGLFGFNPNIAEARGVLIARSVDGTHTASTIDYNATRETPLVIAERTINEVVYGRLSESFDKISGAIG